MVKGASMSSPEGSGPCSLQAILAGPARTRLDMKLRSIDRVTRSGQQEQHNARSSKKQYWILDLGGMTRKVRSMMNQCESQSKTPMI